MQLGELELGDIPAATWNLLQQGVSSSSDPLHTCALGTGGRQRPEVRTVVLRNVDPDQRLLVCHTDRRSSKAGEIVQDGQSTWLFYDRERKLQIRMSGNTVLHTDNAFADICWEASAARSRDCYNTSLGPGQAVSVPPTAPSRIDSPMEAQDARDHFAAIACRVNVLDWLYLSGAGHRRAQFRWNGSTVSATWMTP